MAVGYHFTAKVISRGAGQSAVHTAAYNARTQLADERGGKLTKDYADRGGLLFEGIFAPKDAPGWTKDRAQLWNRAEAAESRKDAQTARNLNVALPYELTDQQREWLVKDFARELARRGMVADVSIHAPDEKGDERNYHAHMLVATRRLDGQKFSTHKARDWNTTESLNEWRADFAKKAGHALERAGFKIEGERWKHGHETLAQQRAAALERGDLAYAAECERDAGRHKGPTVTAMERRGVEIVRADLAEQKEAQQLSGEIKTIEGELQKAEAELAREKAAKIEKAKPAPQIGREAVTAKTEKREAQTRAAEYAKTTKELAKLSGEIERGGKDGLRVAGCVLKVGGKALDTVAKVAEAILDLFDPPKPREITPAEMWASKEAEREYVAQLEAETRETEALDRIADQIQKDKLISYADLLHLGRDSLEQLKARGDEALLSLIRQREEENERSGFGRSRTMER